MTVWIGEGNLAGRTLAAGQAFTLRMLLSGFETAGICLDIRCVAHAMPTSEGRIVA